MPQGEAKPPPGTPAERNAARVAAMRAGPGQKITELDVSAFVVYNRINTGVCGKGKDRKQHLTLAKKQCDLSKRGEQLARELLEYGTFLKWRNKGRTAAADMADSPVPRMAPLSLLSHVTQRTSSVAARHSSSDSIALHPGMSVHSISSRTPKM